MNIGWQEIIALGVVALAALILIRRAFGRRSSQGECCGGSCAAPQSPPDASVKITELHQVKIEHQLPSSDETDQSIAG